MVPAGLPINTVSKHMLLVSRHRKTPPTPYLGGNELSRKGRGQTRCCTSVISVCENFGNLARQGPQREMAYLDPASSAQLRSASSASRISPSGCFPRFLLVPSALAAQCNMHTSGLCAVVMSDYCRPPRTNYPTVEDAGIVRRVKHSNVEAAGQQIEHCCALQ